MTLTKRGGIHFISIGRLRVSWCWKRPNPSGLSDGPIKDAMVFQRQADKDRHSLEAEIRRHVQRQFSTYTPDERNIFGGF
jgi:hypothetical protein